MIINITLESSLIFKTLKIGQKTIPQQRKQIFLTQTDTLQYILVMHRSWTGC